MILIGEEYHISHETYNIFSSLPHEKATGMAHSIPGGTSSIASPSRSEVAALYCHVEPAPEVTVFPAVRSDAACDTGF